MQEDISKKIPCPWNNLPGQVKLFVRESAILITFEHFTGEILYRQGSNLELNVGRPLPSGNLNGFSKSINYSLLV